MSYVGLSQNKLKEYTKKRINFIGECNSLKHKYKEDFSFFVNYLFVRHPNYPKKTNGLIDIIIKYNNYNNL